MRYPITINPPHLTKVTAIVSIIVAVLLLSMIWGFWEIEIIENQGATINWILIVGIVVILLMLPFAFLSEQSVIIEKDKIIAKKWSTYFFGFPKERFFPLQQIKYSDIEQENIGNLEPIFRTVVKLWNFDHTKQEKIYFYPTTSVEEIRDKLRKATLL